MGAAFDKLHSFKEQYENNVREAAAYITSNLIKQKPKIALTLGSGLNHLADKLKDKKEIPYHQIPNFPNLTVLGHAGILISGTIEDVPILCLKGRKHYYEVADMPDGMLHAMFPVHVCAELGIETYMGTNASGGLNKTYSVGDIMIISSHINMIPSPLLGRKMHFTQIDGTKCPRFQPMNNAYDKDLRALVHEYCQDKDYIHEGTYLAVTGPTYETEAESVMFRDGLFADSVGMSTAPEVIVARNRGMNVFGFSCITNVIQEDGTNATNHEEVLSVLQSQRTKDRLTDFVLHFFSGYHKKYP
jgi:purine-nucleoside phosphorylase